MTFPHPLPRTFRYLEWIIIAASLGMHLNGAGNWLTTLQFYGCFFLLSWIFPSHRPDWQRLSYVIGALMLIIFVKQIRIDLDLLLFVYLAKSYFLLDRRTAIVIASIAALPWAVSDYLAQVAWVRQSPEPIPHSVFNPNAPIEFTLYMLVVYTAASTFTLMFSAMISAEQRSRQRAKELSQQVESLAASLERTRIARELHDSLGHTLTDLDIQLEVAQKLRFHNPEQAFQAVDMAKILARQCIEDVSQALHQIRQSDFDLNQALTALLEQVRQTSLLQVQWEVNLPQLPIHESYQIYCMIKEGIMNVQKHAQASQLSFYGGLTPQGIVLNLKDNGIGSDLETLYTGFGIQGIAERVQLLGGKLEIKTALAQGTQIQIILPP
jgi:signal transduction histidine kinase